MRRLGRRPKGAAIEDGAHGIAPPPASHSLAPPARRAAWAGALPEVGGRNRAAPPAIPRTAAVPSTRPQTALRSPTGNGRGRASGSRRLASRRPPSRPPRPRRARGRCGGAAAALQRKRVLCCCVHSMICGCIAVHITVGASAMLLFCADVHHVRYIACWTCIYIDVKGYHDDDGRLSHRAGTQLYVLWYVLDVQRNACTTGLLSVCVVVLLLVRTYVQTYSYTLVSLYDYRSGAREGHFMRQVRRR